MNCVLNPIGLICGRCVVATVDRCVHAPCFRPDLGRPLATESGPSCVDGYVWSTGLKILPAALPAASLKLH